MNGKRKEDMNADNAIPEDTKTNLQKTTLPTNPKVLQKKYRKKLLKESMPVEI